MHLNTELTGKCFGIIVLFCAEFTFGCNTILSKYKKPFPEPFGP